MFSRRHVASAILVPCFAAAAQGQGTATPLPDPCGNASSVYASCAYAIIPVWNGLSVSAGASERHVATLNFFRARDLRPYFPGSGAAADSARRHAAGAVRLRRRAALLSNSGMALLGAAAMRSLLGGSVRDADRIGFAVGGAAFAASVPIHFAADGALSRSVWWYNVRWAR